MKRSPVALFVYNRPWHTEQTIAALLKNEGAADTDLFIFSDGPRTPADAEKVEEVRAFGLSITGFQSTKLVASETNKGLARSIIGGVTTVLNEHPTVIVMEDDLVTSPFFLRYMNESLAMYEHNDEVASIHGYVYPVTSTLPETFFLRGADCWGWATWKRGWALFEADGKKLLDQLESSGQIHAFDMDGNYSYSTMLRKQIEGRNDSWAVRWHASAFLKHKLTLYPGTSLVNNIGLDSSGTHSGSTDEYQTNLIHRPVRLERLPLQENREARGIIAHYLKGLKKNRLMSLASEVRHSLKTMWSRSSGGKK
jgi:hypothetical protein